MHPGHALVTLMARRRAPARLQMGDCNISIQLWPSLFACNGGLRAPSISRLTPRSLGPTADHGTNWRRGVQVTLLLMFATFPRSRPSVKSTPRVDRGLQPRQLGR